MSTTTVKNKLLRYLKQPSTLQGLNVLANVVAIKYGIPVEAVLGAGAMVAAGILIMQDDDKPKSKEKQE